MFKWIQILIVLAFSQSLYALSEEECQFAGHGTSAFDETRRNEIATCADGTVQLALRGAPQNPCKNQDYSRVPKKSSSSDGVR